MKTTGVWILLSCLSCSSGFVANKSFRLKPSFAPGYPTNMDNFRFRSILMSTLKEESETSRASSEVKIERDVAKGEKISQNEKAEEEGRGSPESLKIKVTSSQKELEASNEDSDELDMPWSEIQDWALRDQLPKYTVMLELAREGQPPRMEAYGLWRTMLREVSELSGYPIEFLQKMHTKQILKGNTVIQKTPRTLPYIDAFEFQSAGGVSGNVYGLAGLADGSRIETSSVADVPLTIPKGYIRLADKSLAYELGSPRNEEAASSLQAMAGGSLLKSVANRGSSMQMAPLEAGESGDDMLVRLGAASGILLAGATAINMLSHHLTVNVFWV